MSDLSDKYERDLRDEPSAFNRLSIIGRAALDTELEDDEYRKLVAIDNAL